VHSIAFDRCALGHDVRMNRLEVVHRIGDEVLGEPGRLIRAVVHAHHPHRLIAGRGVLGRPGQRAVCCV
jgi:hypothetical protein